MKPITKKQLILKAIADGDTTKLPKPSSKLETYLYIWAKGSGKIPAPANREEIYLAYLASQNGGTGFSTNPPAPVSRKEIFYHAIANGITPSIKAISRYEMFLQAVATTGTTVMPSPNTVEEYYLKFLAENMKDNNTYGEITLSAATVTVNEKATTTINVKLASAPSVNQTVNVSVNNGYASVDKTTLTFTPSNYNSNQVVTITGAHMPSNFNNNKCIITFRSKKTVATKTCAVTVNNVDADTTPYMWYGRLSFAEVGGKVIQFNAVTENMIKNSSNLVKTSPKTLGKTSLGLASTTSENDYQVIIVPKNYTVTKDNGLGGKTIFDEDVAGANGIDITINTVAYKLYGEILLAQGETFIYVD